VKRGLCSTLTAVSLSRKFVLRQEKRRTQEREEDQLLLLSFIEQQGRILRMNESFLKEMTMNERSIREVVKRTE
jgi:hypothetical protein